MSRGYSTSNFDVSRPFTRESLEQLKSYFKTPLEPSVSWHPATDCQNPPVTPGASSSDHISSASPSGPFKPYAYDPSHPRHAAVLVPIANVAVPSDLRAAGTDPMQPSILLEVRSSNMRSHGGEVSFPGGKWDKTDASLLDAAIRETSEELGVSVDQIEYLGQFAEPEVSYKGLVVWPFLAFVHQRRDARPGVLPELDLTRLRLSSAEVQSVVALPLPSLQSLSISKIPALKLERQLFRNRFPYEVIDISKAPVLETAERSTGWTTSIVSRGLTDKVEVWGLTGWFVDVFLRRLGIWTEIDRKPVANHVPPEHTYRSGL
ncbi:hypothetical protein NliqN6_3559 [Naganishia liquefaciens]|uniref:Nudix hydrolase domain-containing protein n=1 Tax=Naganishia liquefaciens TaxID=104408 RepID=A0A8H3TU08_9TREE|nr:hypothetical protein NliqN6_3559 [Naganishia liquefaciens]